MKHIVLGSDVSNMLAEKGAEGDGAFFAGRFARDAREKPEKGCVLRSSMQCVVMRRLRIARMWKHPR